MQRRFALLIATVLVVITLAVHWRVIGAEFVRWDDPAAITENPNLGPMSWDRIRWAFSDVQSTQRYMPLSLLSWVVTYQFWKLDPAGYHLGNLLLHAGSVALLFGSLLQLNRWIKPRNSNPEELCRTLPAAAGALLWGLHPLRTEPVAWCTARPYDVATFFCLLSLFFYMRRFPDRRQPIWMSRAFLVSVVAFMAAILSHPMCLFFAISFVLLDWAFARTIDEPSERRQFMVRRLFEKAPYAIGIVIIGVVTIIARYHDTGVYVSAASLSDFSVVQRMSQAVYLWWYYTWRPLWPMHLSPVYTTLLDVQALGWRFLMSDVMVVLVSLTLLFFRRHFPLLLGLWIYHLVVLIPTLGWTEHPHYPTDRYSLLSSISWSVLLTVGWTRYLCAFRKPIARGISATAFAFILLLLGWLSVIQSSRWQNSVSLFRHIITELGDDPYRVDLLVRLGPILDEQGDKQGAIAALQQALDIDPNSIAALDYMGQLHWNHQRPAEAAVVWSRQLQLMPEQQTLRCNLAMALDQSGETQQAIQILMDGLDTDAPALDTRYVLGLLLAKSGKVPLAIDQFEYILSVDPKHVLAADALRLARLRLQQEQSQR